LNVIDFSEHRILRMVTDFAKSGCSKLPRYWW